MTSLAIAMLTFATLAISTLTAASLLPQTAYAETEAGYVILGNDTEIEQLTNAYHDAQDEVAAMCVQADELQQHIDDVQGQIPQQQERSDRALRLRYKTQSEPLAILSALFDASSLDDFFKQTEYIQRVSKANLEEINKSKQLEEELDAAKEEQRILRESIETKAEEARLSLEAEQDARAKRAADGIARAKEQAATIGGEASIGVAYDGGEQPEDYKEAATTDTAALDDGANWHADRDQFIDEWAPRIDAYLAGSALAGQGRSFATAAWKYNVDPRWSPAISNTESGKGAVCIRPHNAWGWGAADADPYGLASEWASWEEAIDAHVKGLSNGYGYTITMNGSKMYCPNTWQSWYNKTLGEMSRI